MNTQKLILDQSDGKESVRRAELTIDLYSNAEETVRALYLLMLIMGFEKETVDCYIDRNGMIPLEDDE